MERGLDILPEQSDSSLGGVPGAHLFLARVGRRAAQNGTVAVVLCLSACGCP